MSNIQLINSKGLFSNISLQPLLTIHAFELMKKRVDELQNTPNLSSADKKNLSKVSAAVELMNSFPVETEFMYFRPNDSATPSCKYGNSSCVCVYVADNFVTTTNSVHSKSSLTLSGVMDRLGEQENVAEYLSALKNFSKDMDITFNASTLERSKKLKKSIDSGEVTIREYDPSLDLGQVDACAIFLPTSNGGGYLNGRGEISPLSGARLFESAGSARKTIMSRSLRDAVVVHLRAQLKGIDKDQQAVSSNISGLQAAIAKIEKQTLEQALEHATLEQLKERLARYENPEPPSNAAAPRRRM